MQTTTGCEELRLGGETEQRNCWRDRALSNLNCQRAALRLTYARRSDRGRARRPEVIRRVFGRERMGLMYDGASRRVNPRRSQRATASAPQRLRRGGYTGILATSTISSTCRSIALGTGASPRNTALIQTAVVRASFAFGNSPSVTSGDERSCGTRVSQAPSCNQAACAWRRVSATASP